jgi:hypothetical protein
MLPDLRKFKGKVERRLRRSLEDRIQAYAPLVARIRVHVQQEGDRFSHETHDGDVVRERFRRLSTPMKTEVVASPIEQAVDIAKKLDEAAKDMAAQQMRLLLEKITASSERAGTAVDAGGRPLDMDMFIEVHERLSIDFDQYGRPTLPTTVMHPETAAAIAPKIAEWQKDAAFRARFDAVIDRKREEWRDRESRRKLVG